jgi:putative aldouronate transport system permease protein
LHRYDDNTECAERGDNLRRRVSKQRRTRVSLIFENDSHSRSKTPSVIESIFHFALSKLPLHWFHQEEKDVRADGLTSARDNPNRPNSLARTVGPLSGLRKRYRMYGALLVMLIPGLVYYTIFQYGPMYGVIIAFKDYKIIQGILGSPWVGLEHFRYMFQGHSFPEVFRNTVILGVLKLVIGFPMPIVLALVLNEVYRSGIKRTVQTVSYLPHFLSWVILGGIFMQFFSLNGPVNEILTWLGIDPISFFTRPEWFRVLLVATYVWKTMGWGSIVYIAAISAIDPQLYEAAIVDGANRLRRMIHITLPSLAPVITIMFILSAGRLIKDDFDQIFNMYNPAVYRTGDVISTYAFRQGIEQFNYSFATAVDLFKNVIAFALVYATNRLSRRINEYGVW